MQPCCATPATCKQAELLQDVLGSNKVKRLSRLAITGIGIFSMHHIMSPLVLHLSLP